MKNKKKVVIISLILAIIILAICIACIVCIKIFNPSIRAVVVEAYQNTSYKDSIIVMDINDKVLYIVTLPKEINEQFKQGQEVLIYTNGEGIIKMSSPAYIDSDCVKKIEIVKENSNTKIPEDILRSDYSSVNLRMKAVVVKAYQNSTYEDSITVMDTYDNGLYTVSLPEEINEQFKQGQEVLIYTNGNGFIELTNPAHINSNSIEKIEIVKEKSDTKIPENILRWLYKAPDEGAENISISIDEILPTKLTLTIKDTNPYKIEYKFFNDYEIRKTNGGESLQKNDYSKVETINIDDSTIKNIYNWENVYGKLESGEYTLYTSARSESIRLNISISLTVDSENGTVTYEKPLCSYVAM